MGLEYIVSLPPPTVTKLVAGTRAGVLAWAKTPCLGQGGSFSSFFKIFWLFCAACGILVPQPGIEPVSPAVEAWSLNHWTTREGPVLFLFEFAQPVTQLMLRLEQHKIYSMAKDWRSGNLVSKSISQPDSGGDTIYIGESR